MTLRPAVLDDAPALAQIHAASFAAAWDAREIADVLTGPGGFGLVVELEPGRPAGFILCRALVGEAEVLTLAVAPEARGRGLGAGLMAAALILAGQAGARAMFLEVAADNEPAIRVYDQAGFAPVGRRRDYYRHGRLAPMDALVYRRDLD